MSQRLFAEALGVSTKTVEAWEAGTNTPSGVANRMLELLVRDSAILERCAIVARQ
jgi:putative transcriptional regulator